MNEGGATTPVARPVAFYLPQYHPIPLNDAQYGEGFTEWTHVRAARPLFRGHRQPVVPGELGYYDLRDDEVREAQARLATAYGIEAFLYWHYWSEGQRLLERPFEEVLASGRPDFGFCLAWANHDWRPIGDRNGPVLFEQRYGDDAEIDRHFAALEPAFHDRRYVTVDGAPLFYFFRPAEVPDLGRFCDRWRVLAQRSGLAGVHFVGQHRGAGDAPFDGVFGSVLDGVVPASPFPNGGRTLPRRLVDRVRGGPKIADHGDLVRFFPAPVAGAKESYPCVVPNWDATPRWGRQAEVLHNEQPANVRRLMEKAIDQVRPLPPEHRLVFIKSWNEWAEGNHLEPDERHGLAFLAAIRDAVEQASR